MKILLASLATLLTMIALDFVWLGVAAKAMYARELGPLLLSEPKLWAAAIFYYVVYVVGIMAFAVVPGRGQTLRHAMTRGALFGFVAYATYDLTNLATLKGFSAAIVLPDLAWGAVLTGVAARAGAAALRRLER